MSKKPAFLFYPGDWLRDGVSGCSLAAQGLWLRMMIVMHQSPKYGHLTHNGDPMPDDQIARRCGCGLDEYQVLFAELVLAGVPRFDKGIIYSKRMVDDQKKREKETVRKRIYRQKRIVPSLSRPCPTGTEAGQHRIKDIKHRVETSNTPSPLFPTPERIKKEEEAQLRPTAAFEGKYLSVSEDYLSKLLSEYKGVPGREWLLRFFSRIDDYVGDNPRRYKRDAKGKLKSPSAIIRNWLDRETFGAPRSEAAPVESPMSRQKASDILKRWKEEE